MDPRTPNTPLSLAEPGLRTASKCKFPKRDLVSAHYNDHLWDPYEDFTQANGSQTNHNILLAEGDPYGSYLATTPYDLGPQAYPPANVLTPGMAPYATMPYDPPLQAYPPANVLTPGLAPYTTPYEMGPPFAQGHAFATATTIPSPYSAPTNNPKPEHSSNSSTAGKNKASKPRSICTTCGRDFSRASDMQRHAKKHGDAKYFQCAVAGCKYAGSYRKDKLEQHVRNVH